MTHSFQRLDIARRIRVRFPAEADNFLLVTVFASGAQSASDSMHTQIKRLERKTDYSSSIP
jgi:hypothetical protein